MEGEVEKGIGAATTTTRTKNENGKLK